MSLDRLAAAPGPSNSTTASSCPLARVFQRPSGPRSRYHAWLEPHLCLVNGTKCPFVAYSKRGHYITEAAHHQIQLATSFELPEPWRRRWRLKIRDKETVEPPHVSLLRGPQCWRICLRTGLFIDRRPDPDDVPSRLVKEVLSRIDEFVPIWDAIYPLNPVNSEEQDADGEA
jgi:hypothetical protein